MPIVGRLPRSVKLEVVRVETNTRIGMSVSRTGLESEPHTPVLPE
ncbi:MAG: hypothetical protein U0792_21440 [Gemmataceae bacterium]